MTPPLSVSCSQQEVVFCYTILEENRRLTLSLQASVGTQAESMASNHLDCFFPFDPYWLQRQAILIYRLGIQVSLAI